MGTCTFLLLHKITMSFCPCVHPFDVTHDDPPSSSCPNGIIQSSNCANGVVYPVPSAGSSVFYTTWSWVYCMICIGLVVVYAILHGLGKKLPKLGKATNNVVYRIVMISLIAMGAINSVGVLSTSQLLLTKNFKLVNKDDPKKPIPDNLSISTTFFHNAMEINFDAHIVPGILAILILVLLGTCKSSKQRSWKASLGLLGGMLSAQILLVFLWMAVPVKDEKTGKTYQWIQKLKYVYADPPGYFFGVQALLVIVLSLAMSFKIA